MKFVVGSTGLLGSLVATKLAISHRSIAGLFREPISEKAWALASAGVKLIPGDLKDAASLDRALSGVDTVVCTASSTLSRRNGDSIEAVDHQGVQSLIASAEGAGVRDFVFVSYDSDGHSYPLALAKQAAERRLRSSRLNWTIVQASFFCEIWFSSAVGFDRKAGSVRIYGNGDQGGIRHVHRAEVPLRRHERNHRVIALPTERHVLRGVGRVGIDRHLI